MPTNVLKISYSITPAVKTYGYEYPVEVLCCIVNLAVWGTQIATF